MQGRIAAQLDAPIINGERYMIVIIPSYNNAKWYKLNLGYLFQQKYNNYRVIYIDDCSTDGTAELVQQFVKACGQEHRVTLIKNIERHGALYNLYHAIHGCPDRAIIMTLDGDDWFKRADVLQIINAAYADPNVWLTYGQYEEFPRGSLGICHPMPDAVIAAKDYRSHKWFTSHLRTFYAGLFKQVKEEDLKYGDDFFSVTWDQAFMFPMLEMANGRIKFIDEILYVYNQANPLNDFKLKLRNQLMCERIIRAKERYEPLDDARAKTFCLAA
jgi:glycosyltransferase involved in cell wall biosynthesis